MAYRGRVTFAMRRVNQMETGMVKIMHRTSGSEIEHIMTKLPTTVTVLVRMWITSEARLVDTTSIS